MVHHQMNMKVWKDQHIKNNNRIISVKAIMMVMINTQGQNQLNLNQHLVKVNLMNYSFQRWRTIYFYPTQKKQLKINNIKTKGDIKNLGNIE